MTFGKLYLVSFVKARSPFPQWNTQALTPGVPHERYNASFFSEELPDLLVVVEVKGLDF
jgi:hypothetical protein